MKDTHKCCLLPSLPLPLQGPLEVLGRRAGRARLEKSDSPPQKRMAAPGSAAGGGGSATGDLAQSREEEDGVMLGGSGEDGNARARRNKKKNCRTVGWVALYKAAPRDEDCPHRIATLIGFDTGPSRYKDAYNGIRTPML